MPVSEIYVPELLRDQVALVTGGATGLGFASARELIACGAEVVIVGRREEALAAAAAKLGDRCKYWQLDIRDRQQSSEVVDAVIKQHGKIDLLLNNAGGQYFAPAESITAKGWQAVFKLNLAATLKISRLVAERAMLPAGQGMIINTTLSPHHGLTGMTHSSAARAAVEKLTHKLASEWQGKGVSVVAIADGHFATDVIAKYPPEVHQSLGRSVPLGRLGRPIEHAWLVALLTSPLGKSLSGSTITIDGGRDNWYGPWPPPPLIDQEGKVPVEERT